MKKFEEGVFSDLRNLKPGVDACLEDPKVSRSSTLCRLVVVEEEEDRNEPCTTSFLWV
jgi:hypothetical protein